MKFIKEMLTIADEEGEGAKAIADDCWRGGRGGLKTSEIGWRNMWTAPNTSGKNGFASCLFGRATVISSNILTRHYQNIKVQID